LTFYVCFIFGWFIYFVEFLKQRKLNLTMGSFQAVVVVVESVNIFLFETADFLLIQNEFLFLYLNVSVVF